MNNARRAKLTRIRDDIQNIVGRLDYVLFEEQIAIDNIPENLRMSENYYAMETTIETIEEAIDDLRDSVEAIETITAGNK